MDKKENKTSWKIEKSVNISHIVLVITLGWGAASWADDAHDNLTSRMNSVEQSLDHQKEMIKMQQENTVKKIDRLDATIRDLTMVIRDMEKRHK